jgi:hypothetical protein
MSASLIFAASAATRRSGQEAIILAQSIRTFAGRFADCPVWVLIPDSKHGIEVKNQRQLLELESQVIAFPIEERVLDFPLASKVVAAAAAEQLADGEGEILAWMDVDSLVIDEPDLMVLDQGTKLGYRPVDHTLIGSRYDEPVDPFWNLIYRFCRVSEDRLFPMTTTVDQVVIRPYFNAGLLVTRPELGLLRRWRDSFLDFYREPVWDKFFEESVLYRIFLHQAILAGVILTTVDHDEIIELSSRLNYPLHMHLQYPPSARAKSVDDLVSCRYDILLKDPEWQSKIPVGERFYRWLETQLQAAGLNGGNDGKSKDNSDP